MTNNTTNTFPSIHALPLQDMPKDAAEFARYGLNNANVHHSTIVGHSADVAAGTALLTLTITVPVSSSPQLTQLQRTEQLVEEGGRVFAALDLLTHGKPATLHSIALNSTDVLPPAPTSPLEAFKVEVDRTLVLRRTVTEEAKVLQTLEVVIVAASMKAAQEMANEHAEELLQNNEDTFLDNLDQSCEEWETVEERRGWESEVHRRTDVDVTGVVHYARCELTKPMIEAAHDDSALIVQVPTDEDGGSWECDVNPRDLQPLLGDLFAELDRVYGGSN